MEEVIESQEVTTEMTPGAKLRQARIARRMTPEYVARELKLSLTWVNDLESDQYERATAAIYVKGYLRAYARLVEVAEQEVLTAFDRLGVEAPMAARRAASEAAVRLRTEDLAHMQNRAAQRSLWIWALALVVGLGSAMGILWWRGEHSLTRAVTDSVNKVRNAMTDNATSAAGGVQAAPVAIPSTGTTETIPLSAPESVAPASEATSQATPQTTPQTSVVLPSASTVPVARVKPVTPLAPQVKAAALPEPEPALGGED